VDKDRVSLGRLLLRRVGRIYDTRCCDFKLYFSQPLRLMSRSLSAASRKLYKQLIFAARFYPLPGYDIVKQKAKKEFLDNAHLQDAEKIKEAIAKGRWYLREIEALNGLAKVMILTRFTFSLTTHFSVSLSQEEL
jgi:hypothetical protein